MWLLQVAVEDILSQHFVHPLERLAMLTVGYAGSDIRDVVHHGLPQDDLAPMVTFDSLLGGLAKVCGLPGACANTATAQVTPTLELPPGEAALHDPRTGGHHSSRVVTDARGHKRNRCKLARHAWTVHVHV